MSNTLKNKVNPAPNAYFIGHFDFFDNYKKTPNMVIHQIWCGVN